MFKIIVRDSRGKKWEVFHNTLSSAKRWVEKQKFLSPDDVCEIKEYE